MDEARSPTPPPKTIVYTIFGMPRAGAEVALLELVRGLDKTRFKPVVVVLGTAGDLSADFVDAGIPLQHLGMTRLSQGPVTFLRAVAAVRKERPALVHGFMFYGSLAARLLKLVGVAPVVVSALHSVNIGPRWTELAMRLTDRFGDSVTAVSQAVASAQIAARSVPAHKVEVIENGIDLAQFNRPSAEELAALRERLGLSPTQRVVLCVGRLTAVKNHAGLLSVFAQLAARHADVQLVIVGKGELEAELRARVDELGLQRRVTFAGLLAPVAPVFYLADVFVLSSFHEGLPLVVLEAMAAERAMVLTRVGGIPEVVEHEATGILVEPRDDAALEAALERMLAAPLDERLALGRAARSDVSRRFSMERVVARTESLYERLVGAQRSEPSPRARCDAEASS